MELCMRRSGLKEECLGFLGEFDVERELENSRHR